jgi:hypothetical protein
MAGDWIKMKKSLPRDPRVVRISSALKADRLRTVGGLLSAWCLFDEQTEDGRLEGYTPELMDEIIGMQGLARAMASVNWLEIGEGFLAVPRFDEHNGQSAKRRSQESVRKMSARKADKCPQTKRTESGPEKRREENRVSKETLSSPTPSFDDENPDYSDKFPTGTASELMDAEKWIQSLRKGWKLPLNYTERRALMANASAILSMTPEDKQAIRDYLYARIPEGMPKWQPANRDKFIESITNVFNYASEWSRKNKPATSQPRTGGWK